ncbi:MAG: SusD/RagB family nutrient-binding outer membrane lipoprotein [Cryomorphaceae bacterium MED-G14]|nr:MAG: SusD/RagB family nutrient-binding outer membrane lipoprotein [Cryomorphaceae bacterium MED-G14]|tara:strand:- start:754 stop:2454 length:1701 start_codon:yes stop_codon:yes gene_type:complete
MKKIIFLAFSALFIISSCTSDFDEINEKPDALTAKDVSAKYFVTGLQQVFFAPNRYPYWRGPLIHFDRFSGQHIFGDKNCWWNEELAYTYHPAYTQATYDWMANYNSTLTSFMNFTKVGGTLENENYYAIGLIMKGLYYQRFTDTFGMIPYTEASDPDITTPKYDDQKTIYDGVFADLNTAIDIIGSKTTTGEGPELLVENDLFFKGNLQDWKALANSLKLKMALRAHGSGGVDYSAHVTAASSGVLGTKNALLPRDTEINMWSSATYGDIWWSFPVNALWTMGSKVVDVLQNNNDPRLSKYAKPIEGGKKVLKKPTAGPNVALFKKHTDFIINHLKDSGVELTTKEESNGDITVTIGSGVYYAGKPARTIGAFNQYSHIEFFSKPSDLITQKKNQGKPIHPYQVMTAAESHFLLAEAAVKGVGTGSANTHYQNGIRKAMELWEVPAAQIDKYLAEESMATLTGTGDLEKIATQRWLAHYSDGMEAWAVMRDTGFPLIYKNTNGIGYKSTNTVSDKDIYHLGDLNGAFPQRLRYSSSPYNTNSANTEAANAIQGPDKQATKLWWAK